MALTLFKIDGLSEIVKRIQKVDDGLNDLSVKHKIEYKHSFLYQLKTLLSILILLLLAGIYDYFVFQSWVINKLKIQ